MMVSPPASEGGATPEPMPTVEVQPEGVTTVMGAANYQNRPDNGGILVQLLQNGGVVREVLTSSDGSFSLDGVESGTYILQISAPQHIVQQLQLVVDANSGQPPQVEAAVLYGGDVDDSGAIDLVDAALIGANFGLEIIPEFVNLDVNADGLVNISDLTMVGGNIGMSNP
jgi:hypothetical protein